MAEKKEETTAGAASGSASKTTYVATEALRMPNGVLAFTEGQEVPEHVLKGEHAKANGWSDKVKKQ